jgi:hypothetical protein
VSVFLIADVFVAEMNFSRTISLVIKDYVTPLMDSRGLIIKPECIKHMFEDLTKLHTHTLGFLETIKMDLKLYKTEESLTRGIENIIENLVDEMENSYSKYASNFSKTVFLLP